MKKVILTEQSNPATINIDISTTLEMVEMMNVENAKVAIAVEKEKKQIANAIDLITKKILNGGHLLYFGAGTSGRLGVLDASECPPTFGVSADMVRGYIAGGDSALKNAIEGAEDNYEQGIIDFQNANVESNDVVVGISASGNPAWLLAILKEAKTNNISTIAIVNNPDAKLKEFADIFICPIVEQEVITGSSRLKAGSAQKLVLNMLSTGIMIKIGKTYKNFMIDVQPTNQKLKDRAIRFVSEIANVSEDVAKSALEKTDFSVKTAIITLICNCSKDEANKKLSEKNGILRKVLE